MEIVLEDIRRLIKENILPRLDQMEYELYMLRKHTWPYVQSKREMTQLDKMPEKMEFLKCLDTEVIQELLVIKGQYSKSGNLCVQEYDMLKNISG